MTPAANSWVMDAPPPRLHRTILASFENAILHSGQAAGNNRAAHWLARDRAGGR